MVFYVAISVVTSVFRVPSGELSFRPNWILILMALGSVLSSTFSFAEGGQAADALEDLSSAYFMGMKFEEGRRMGGWRAGEARQHFRACTELRDVTSALS